MVVSNTSPLNYLIQIGAIDLLPRVYGEIHVPRLVLKELSDPAAPKEVSRWGRRPPKWLRIEEILPAIPESLGHLHAGEAAAIAMGVHRMADLLLIDDLDGRRAARKAGLNVMGILGFLDAAACHGLADFHSLLDALTITNFRAPRSLMDALRERHSQD